MIVDRPGSVQSELRVGHVGIARGHADYFPAIVMASLLGGTFSSRLNQRLREDLGYTYGARAAFDPRRAAGPFIARAAVHTEVTADAVRETLGLLEGMQAAPPAAEELREVTDYLVGVFPLRFETTIGAAAGIEPVAVYELDHEWWATYRDRIEAVGPGEVHHAATTLLRPAEALVLVRAETPPQSVRRSRKRIWAGSRSFDRRTTASRRTAPKPRLVARAPVRRGFDWARSKRARARARRSEGWPRTRARVERVGVLAAGNLRQEGRRPLELAGVGQELDARVPPVPVADREREESLEQVVGGVMTPGSSLREVGRPEVGRGRLHGQPGEVVEQQIGVRRALGGRPAADVALAEVAQQRLELTLDPDPGRGLGGPSCAGLGQERRTGEMAVGGLVGLPQAGSGQGLERGVDLDQPFLGADPVLETAALVVVRGREPQPVPLAVVPPVLAVDVVLHDPPPLGVRPVEEDRGRHAKPGDRAPGRLVPRARLGRDLRTPGAPRPVRRRMPGLAGGQGPGHGRGHAPLQGPVVRSTSERVAELATMPG